MSTEMAIWRIDEGEKAQPLSLGGIDFENKLENVIENDPSTIDPNLLVIGRQVRTDGGPIDLLAIDPEGRLVVIELKRNKTSREVIAQALDYGSSLRDKAEEEIKEIFTQYQLSRGVSQPEEIYAALEKRFGGSPDELNRSPNESGDSPTRGNVSMTMRPLYRVRSRGIREKKRRTGWCAAPRQAPDVASHPNRKFVA